MKEILDNLFGKDVPLPIQLFGFAGVLLAFFIYIFKDRKKILITKLIADTCWVIHYFGIGATSGGAINIVAMGRETVFLNKKRKWASYPIWPAIFVSATVVSSIISWQGPLSILPMVGSAVAAFALWSTKPLLIRLISIPSTSLWLIYALISGSLPATICNILSISAMLIGLARDLIDLRKKRQNPISAPVTESDKADVSEENNVSEE
ncbi:MAG: YgjV family protein [Clostridia bacterium]|nr:YgjV family protein [Clostridia bacterium]